MTINQYGFEGKKAMQSTLEENFILVGSFWRHRIIHTGFVAKDPGRVS
jgi:hypothetical protein